jgi:hypothetical protein
MPLRMAVKRGQPEMTVAKMYTLESSHATGVSTMCCPHRRPCATRAACSAEGAPPLVPVDPVSLDDKEGPLHALQLCSHLFCHNCC